MAPNYFILNVLFVFVFNLTYRPVRKHRRLQQSPIWSVRLHKLDKPALVLAVPPPVLSLQSRWLLQQRPAIVALLGRLALKLRRYSLPVYFLFTGALDQLLEQPFLCIGPFHLAW